jgi:hypothetical protein
MKFILSVVFLTLAVSFQKAAAQSAQALDQRVLSERRKLLEKIPPDTKNDFWYSAGSVLCQYSSSCVSNM